jgi:hypothetical protein
MLLIALQVTASPALHAKLPKYLPALCSMKPGLAQLALSSALLSPSEALYRCWKTLPGMPPSKF